MGFPIPGKSFRVTVGALGSLMGSLLGSLLPCSAHALGGVPQVQKLGGLELLSVDPETILYQEGSMGIVGTLPPDDKDGKNFYVVHTGLTFIPPPALEKYGQLLGFVPGQFSFMRLSPDEAEKLASELHSEAIGCGVLLKLRGEAVSPSFAETPTPLISLKEGQKAFKSLIQKISAESIKTSIDKLTAFHSRFHKSPTGKQVADFLADEYRALAKNRNDVSITTFDHGDETPQKSLIVRVEGTVAPEEIIILGSHLDSVNFRGGAGGRSPGADDNASGTATNLEIFRLLMSQGIKTERTVEIHAYAAEEIGLVGSQDIAQTYKRSEKKVISMVQHDMTLWKSPDSPDKIWFVANNTDPRFNILLGKVVDLYVGVPWEQRSLSGGSSDHASWRRAGFATAFPFEDPSQHNPAIHTARDTTANAPYFDLAAAFARLGLGYVLHFAGATEG